MWEFLLTFLIVKFFVTTHFQKLNLFSKVSITKYDDQNSREFPTVLQ